VKAARYHLSGRKLLAVDEDAETERSLVGPGSRTHVPRPQLEKANEGLTVSRAADMPK